MMSWVSRPYLRVDVDQLGDGVPREVFRVVPVLVGLLRVVRQEVVRPQTGEHDVLVGVVGQLRKLPDE